MENKNYYLKQFELYDGEYFITFNIVPSFIIYVNIKIKACY